MQPLKPLTPKQRAWFSRHAEQAGFTWQMDGELTRRIVVASTQQQLDVVLTHENGGPVRCLDERVHLVVRRCEAPHDVVFDEELFGFRAAQRHLQRLEAQ